MAGFDTLLWNITQAATDMQTMSESIIQSGLQIIPNSLYTLSSDGTLINISELSQASTDGSQLNITELLNGNQLLIGYTIPENLLFTLDDISNITNIIQQGFSIEQLPIFNIGTTDALISDMGVIMNLMMSMFMNMDITATDGTLMDMSAISESFTAMMKTFTDEMDAAKMSEFINLMMDTMEQATSKMVEMIDGMVNAMPMDAFGNMMSVLVDTFTSEILTEGNPFDNMANTMGSMMYAFMKGMTGNTNDIPTQEFALIMGEMINQFMVGLTGDDEDFAWTLGDTIGSMIGDVMSRMTGNPEAPLQSFTAIMSDTMSRLMNEMSTNINSIIDPIISMMNTMLTSMEGNIETIEAMFAINSETMQSMIEMSPEYMATILRLSDDIGLMADRIGEMADKIVQTQVIQSPNFLSTQENAIRLIEILLSEPDSIQSMAGFDTLLWNITQAATDMQTMSESIIQSGLQIIPSNLYIQDSDGTLGIIQENDLILSDGSTVDVSGFLDGRSVFAGYMIPDASSMSFSNLLDLNTMIQSQNYSLQDLPMILTENGMFSIAQMSNMMSFIMGMFIGVQFTPINGTIDSSTISEMTEPFMSMMEIFIGSMNMDAMMPMMDLIMENMISIMSDPDMVESLPHTTQTIIDSISAAMTSMPVESFEQAMGLMMDAFTSEVLTDGNPLDNTAKMIGSMMYAFIEGMTGNTGDVPEHEFAITMGEMINQFMVGLTGSGDNFAQTLGNMMGSMTGSMMAGITSDDITPLQSFTNIMSDMIGRFINDMSTNMTSIMDPISSLLDTMITMIDGNMETLKTMFDSTSQMTENMIDMSPEYMTTILRLSDDIGLMADRIGEMANKIVQTQVIQSPNFLSTQENALNLVDMITENQSSFIDKIGVEAFTAIIENLNKIDSMMSSWIVSDLSARSILPTQLYMQTSSGELIAISESDLLNMDGSTDISEFLNGNQLMAGFAIPNASSMNLNELIEYATLIRNGGLDISQLPIFSLSAQEGSMINISSIMNSILGMLMATGFASTSSIDRSITESFLKIMGSFTGSIENISAEEFSSSIDQLIVSMSNSGMIDSMMQMGNAMMETMSSSFSAASSSSLGTMIQSFGGFMPDANTPMDAIAYMMGSVMFSFMEGFTDSKGETSQYEFAGIMGELSQQFMAAITGNTNAAAAAMGEMMGSMMGAFLSSVTGDTQNPLGSFMDAMMTTQLMDDLSSSVSLAMESITEMMNTMLIAIQGNIDYISSMFDILNNMAQSTIEMSPEYIATILRLSNDIGLMADRIGEMADRIVQTEVLQSVNFLETQQNMLDLITMLTTGSSEFESLMGEALVTVVENLTKFQSTMNSVSIAIENINKTVVPSDLYLINDLGELIRVNETDLLNTTDDTDIASFLDQENLLVGYTIPLDSSMSLSKLISMAQLIEGGNFNLEQLPIFASATSIMDIDTFIGSMLTTNSVNMINVPIDQFNQLMQNFQSHLGLGTSPMDIMGEMIGSMMLAFMGGMIDTDTTQTPLKFAELMGNMIREFTIGITGSEETPIAAMGEMMGGMMSSFMASIMNDELTPMSSFTQATMESFMHFADNATQSMLAAMDPTIELAKMFANDINTYIELFISMFESSDATIDAMIDQTPSYLNTMLMLSGDIGLMADRINEMADRIVGTQEIMSENFLATQQNAIALMSLLTENSDVIEEGMGIDSFSAMMSTLSDAITTLDTIAASGVSQSYASSLYLQSADGKIIQLNSSQLLLNDSLSFDIETMLDGSTLLLGYTIHASSVINMDEWLDITKIPYGITNTTTLPILGSDISLDMNDIIRSMMNMMIGNTIGIPLEQSLSAPFMSIIESFANGMGLSINEFETIFNSIMKTMIINDIVTVMSQTAQTIIELTHMDQFFAPEVIVDTIMDTFMATGTPIAVMADMIGAMMSSLIGAMTNVGVDATPNQMAYSMGEMTRSFIVGITGDETNLATMLGEMIGSTMEAFMDAITAQGEDFAAIMNSLMEQMSTTITTNISMLVEPINDFFLMLSDEMDQTIMQMHSMMTTWNDTTVSILNQSDTFVGAMSTLSNDVIQMTLNIKDMIQKIDQTIELQTDNFIATQNNLNALIDSLVQLYTSSPIEFIKSGMGDVLYNTIIAQNTLDTQLANIGLLAEHETISGFLQGTLEDDAIEGSIDADYIFGLNGNDTINGNDGDDMIHGGDGDDMIHGGDGNDILIDSDGADTFNGKEGDDSIVISDTSSFVFIDGGTGIDTLYLTGDGVTLDLTVISDTKIVGIEKIDITGSGNNTLILNYNDLLALKNDSGILFITGDSGDMVLLPEKVFVDTKTLDNITYNTYSISGATSPDIWVQQEIRVI